MMYDIIFLFTATIIIFTVIIMIGAVMAYFENKEWNNGICAKSGKPWICYDTDSGGNYMYQDYCGNYMEISWLKVFRRNYDDREG